MDLGQAFNRKALSKFGRQDGDDGGRGGGRTFADELGTTESQTPIAANP